MGIKKIYGILIVDFRERFRAFRQNLEAGMDYCLEIADGPAFKDENLVSIPTCVEVQRERLRTMCAVLEQVPVG